MYPRNAASPERIAVGAVVQISDGAVQTSGVSIKVKPQGGAASAGGGTTSYEEGIVGYVPTQAETDYTSFQVIAYKTGCIPVAVTVVTSASATAGYAGTDQGKIANPTSTVNLSGTTIKTATDVETDTADIQSRIPAALVGGRIDASVGAMANNVMTAAAAAADLTTELQSGLATAAALADVQTDTNDIQTRLPAALTADGNIKADTLRVGGTLQTAGDLAAMLTVIDDFLDTEIAAILGDTGTDIPAQIAALNNLSAAQVNAEVVDALATDTYAEPSGTPAATIALATKIGWMYMALRNKLEVTSSKKTFYDDSGAAEWSKSLSDDGTTYAEAEANVP